MLVVMVATVVPPLDHALANDDPRRRPVLVNHDDGLRARAIVHHDDASVRVAGGPGVGVTARPGQRDQR